MTVPSFRTVSGEQDRSPRTVVFGGRPSEEEHDPVTDLPTFRLTLLSGAHPNHNSDALAEDVLHPGGRTAGGRLEGNLFIPTAQTRYEIIATFPSSAHYEEAHRTVIMEVGDGQKEFSKREEFPLRIIDIAKTPSLRAQGHLGAIPPP